MPRRRLSEHGVVTPIGSADLLNDQGKAGRGDFRGLHVAAGMRAAKSGWRWRSGHVSDGQESSRAVQCQSCYRVRMNGLPDASCFDAAIL